MKNPNFIHINSFRDLTIFMSCMGLVCQLSDHQRSICPVFTAGEKVMVPFKAKEKSHSPM